MKHYVTLNGISKHRTIFMGLAILCIMLCHNTIAVPEAFSDIRRVPSQILQCGVDVFMLLSGLGLYYSFNKNSDIVSFLGKRYVKIFPPYIIVVALYGILRIVFQKDITFAQYTWKFSPFSFFVEGELSLWFVPAILLLYTIFPCLYSALQHNSKNFVISCFIVVLICFCIPFLQWPTAITVINSILITRLPAFLSGMIIAKAILDNKNVKIPIIYIWITLIISTVLIVYSLVLRYKDYWLVGRVLFLPFTFSIMLLLAAFMENHRPVNILYKSFSFLGGLTLELYLFHERILAIINSILQKTIPITFTTSIYANIAAILLSVLSAWLLQHAIQIMSHLVSKH